MRRRVIEHERIGRVDHPRRDVGVQIERGHQRHVRAQDLAQGGQYVPFDVRMLVGDHRSVQREQHRVDR